MLPVFGSTPIEAELAKAASNTLSARNRSSIKVTGPLEALTPTFVKYVPVPPDPLLNPVTVRPLAAHEHTTTAPCTTAPLPTAVTFIEFPAAVNVAVTEPD